MKVLFAVSREEISEAIIKQYQKEYREIISYKNVYYFNAILKELQKDKTYDRIVISEDLEPFANNNYDSIDKFIFEKLDSISDEALDSSGQDTAIILICTERRTKASNILVKLFGIGLYNALLGKDRSIAEVCALINRPRTKKEAKAYYKIEADEVNYEAEDSSEVNELELQNILAHYKRLGKNTDRYTDSFNNIASQYNDTQLKIIINCLPMSVKAVLEAESPKYQELMTFSNNNSGGKKKAKIEQRQLKVKQKETEAIKVDMLEENTKRMDKPVVIPGVISSSKVKRATVSVDDDEMDMPKVTTKLKKKVKFADFDDDEDEEEEENLIQETRSKQSRKPTNTVELDEDDTIDLDDFDDFDEDEEPQLTKNKEVFNPREEEDEEDDDFIDLDDFDEDEEEEEKVQPVKKGRGRPKKEVLPGQEEIKPKGKRGRPKKNKVEEEFLPGFDSDEEEEENESFLPGFEEIDEEEDIVNSRNKNIRASKYIDEDEEEDEDSTLPGLFDEEDEDEEEIQPRKISKKPLNIDEDEEEDEEDYEEIQPRKISKRPLDIDDDEEEITFKNNKKSPKSKFMQDDDEDEDDETMLPGMGFEDEDEEEDDFEEDYSQPLNSRNSNNMKSPKGFNSKSSYTDDEDDEPITNELESVKPRTDYSMSSLKSVLTKDKKIVSFVGTTKNGTSFLINSLASLFSSIGVKTALLDMTKNRNSYYIYTKNEENLRKIAFNSIEKLQNGFAEGIKAEKNLTVYTALPNDNKDYSNAEEILSTLVQNYSLVLIDCDFDTDVTYFANSQEIYLVQSMDILTIQPLTGFLRELKTKGILEEEKLRVVINKEVRVRGLSGKAIVGGMSIYNDPAMSFMTDLFNKDKVKCCSIPFEGDVYSKYLETLVNCNISINKYSKNFQKKLKILGEMVYPLLSKTYTPSAPDYSRSNFSNNMNNTLNKMKNKY